MDHKEYFHNPEKRNKSILTFEVYTDGSAKGSDYNHKCGGWAYLIMRDGDIIRKDCGTVLDTTNQRMELQAVLEALKACELLWDEENEYIIYSDSAYVVNCYEQRWWYGWINNNWINSKKQPVANADLWGQIIPFFKRKSYTFRKVKGHADNYYNNMVDEMAQEMAYPWRVKKNDQQRDDDQLFFG